MGGRIWISDVAFSAATLGVSFMPQLVATLGFPFRSTAFRKLHELNATSRHSHRGRYCTLLTSARFDAHGLWVHGEIGLSAHGTFRATMAALAPPRGSAGTRTNSTNCVGARFLCRAPCDSTAPQRR